MLKVGATDVQVSNNNLKIKKKEKNNWLDLFGCSVIKYDGYN